MPQRKKNSTFPFASQRQTCCPQKNQRIVSSRFWYFHRANNQIYFLPKTEWTRQHEDLECFLQDKRVQIFSSKQQTFKGICVLPQRKKFSTFLFVSGANLLHSNQTNAYSSQMLNFQVLGFEMLHKENNSFDITFHRGEMGAELLVLASYKSA